MAFILLIIKPRVQRMNKQEKMIFEEAMKKIANQENASVTQETKNCLLPLIISILVFISSIGYIVPKTLERDKRRSINDLPHYTIRPNTGIITTPTFGPPDSTKVEYFPNGFQ